MGTVILRVELYTRDGKKDTTSPVHANFFINHGRANAADVKALIEIAQRTVREKLGVELELEIEFLGEGMSSRQSWEWDHLGNRKTQREYRMNARKKLQIALIFGGRSGEHEVSLMSARSVLSVLDPPKYAVSQIGITLAGQWLTGEDVIGKFESGKPAGLEPALVLPDPTAGDIQLILNIEPPVPPYIVQHPLSVYVDRDLTNNATFTVEAAGSAPLSYQWLRNGQTIVGATGDELQIVFATPAVGPSCGVDP